MCYYFAYWISNLFSSIGLKPYATEKSVLLLNCLISLRDFMSPEDLTFYICTFSKNALW